MVKPKTSRRKRTKKTELIEQNPEGFASHKLTDLYLSEAAVTRPSVKGNVLPTEIKLTVVIKVGQGQQRPNLVRVSIQLSANGHYERTEDPAVTIQATFFAFYEFPTAAMFDQQEFKQMIRVQALWHIWSYWREFVQSATARMGLPALKMPLIVPGNIQFTHETD